MSGAQRNPEASTAVGAAPGNAKISGKRKACLVALLGFCGLLLLTVAGVVALLLLLGHSSPMARNSALSTAREWARVADFPVSASSVEIEVRGSSFTREFIVTFDAPAGDVEQWVKDSPGLSSVASPRILDDGSTLYEIVPGGGAQFAEVAISASGERVRIRVYWS